VRALATGPRAGRFRLLVFGVVHHSLREEAESTPGVELRGGYRPEELDALLDEVDVGIIPSIWEEAYGYVGPELLAKGIPLIANAIGGIVEYARDGETAWLNRSCSAEELTRIMTGVLEQPERIRDLSERILSARDSVVKPFASHADEMDEIYAELVAREAVA